MALVLATVALFHRMVLKEEMHFIFYAWERIRKIQKTDGQIFAHDEQKESWLKYQKLIQIHF